MSQAKSTTNHETIRRWTEKRGGRPATVKGTAEKNEAGILRIDFGPPEDRLEPIDWDEFFEKFDKEKLAFLYQEKTEDGGESRFFKFVQRDN